MTQRSLVHALSRAGVVLLLALTACGDDDSSTNDAGPTAGKSGNGGKCGGGSGGNGGNGSKCGNGGAGGAGGKAGSSSAGRAATAGTTATAGVGALPAIMCSEEPPKDPFKCGDDTCTAPTEFAMNMCVVPCCVKVDGKDHCASKSTAMGLSTECTLPAVADPACPDVDAMGMPLKGCCNAEKKKCGIISTLRPGCITESMLVTLPSPLQDCTPAESSGGDDAGTADAG